MGFVRRYAGPPVEHADFSGGMAAVIDMAQFHLDGPLAIPTGVVQEVAQCATQQTLLTAYRRESVGMGEFGTCARHLLGHGGQEVE